MPVYLLDESHGFPDPRESMESGLLAMGGDLHPRRLINAYAMGIFPWYGVNSPIQWWSPHPRLVLFPDQFKASRSLIQSTRSSGFGFTADQAFRKVITACAKVPRKEGGGTWITREMKQAYTKLHEMGLAHSVEVWQQQDLVGGLYGVSLGRTFFGESMFYRKRDASKAALWKLCGFLKARGFHFIDAQMHTSHLLSLGARELDRETFLEMLEKAMAYPSLQGSWTSGLAKYLEASSGSG